MKDPGSSVRSTYGGPLRCLAIPTSLVKDELDLLWRGIGALSGETQPFLSPGTLREENMVPAGRRPARMRKEEQLSGTFKDVRVINIYRCPLGSDQGEAAGHDELPPEVELAV